MTFTPVEMVVVFVGGATITWVINAFLKRTVGTKYMTLADLTDILTQKCSSCAKDTKALKADILFSATEERRSDMKHFKDGVEEKLSKIMGVLLVMALKKDGEALKVEDRDKIIELVTERK